MESNHHLCLMRALFYRWTIQRGLDYKIFFWFGGAGRIWTFGYLLVAPSFQDGVLNRTPPLLHDEKLLVHPVGFEPTIYLRVKQAPLATRTRMLGGRWRIRTSGCSRNTCFRNRHNKPDSDNLPKIWWTCRRDSVENRHPSMPSTRTLNKGTPPVTFCLRLLLVLPLLFKLWLLWWKRSKISHATRFCSPDLPPKLPEKFQRWFSSSKKSLQQDSNPQPSDPKSDALVHWAMEAWSPSTELNSD